MFIVIIHGLASVVWVDTILGSRSSPFLCLGWLSLPLFVIVNGADSRGNGQHTRSNTSVHNLHVPTTSSGLPAPAPASENAARTATANAPASVD